MAASDQNYRDQNWLDVVFAVSSILMLFSIVWMFVQDYNREYKHEQRLFRDVESAVAQRLAIGQIPDAATFDAIRGKFLEARAERATRNDEVNKLRAEAAEIEPKREQTEKDFQDIKAIYESTMSFWVIETDNHGKASADKKYGEKLKDLEEQMTKAKAARDLQTDKIQEVQAKITAIDAPLNEAEAAWKKLDDKFDTQVKVSVNKKWGLGDTIRSLPIIDPFAPPIKIHQFTINDVPIDYNFKQVTRFDRCMTCHVGIDRPAYTREMLTSLTSVSEQQQRELDQARLFLKSFQSGMRGLPGGKMAIPPDQLDLTVVPKTELTPSRITEFCAHPRLELFVGANSKHPAEKFGCTSCHAGQPSGTSFNNAGHSPNNSTQKSKWNKDYHWESNHMWDFPMQPHRFIESSCLKCHYQVTDLYGSNNRNEAPKLLRGYNLIRENGCFGCHEIAGRKGGRQVGPDLRLEPYPPLEDLTEAERTKIQSDVDNPPGTHRKVGPSLFRLSEKTNKEWTSKWLRSPRAFRPDTKMPHFYGLSNNDPSVLPDDQKSFPDAEINAITHYLFEASRDYMRDVAAAHKDSADQRAKDAAELTRLQSLPKMTDEESKQLETVKRRIKLRETPLLTDLAPGYKADAKKGRQLFSEKGCLACHSHQGTDKVSGTAGNPDYAPAIVSEANFGPNLSQLKEKLGSTPGDAESARRWLIQWVLNPHIYSPRSRMPITHLDNQQAADIAAWLLDQDAGDSNGPGWKDLTVPDPNVDTLKSLASVYLIRLMSKSDMEKFLEGGELPKSQIQNLPVEEQELSKDAKDEKYLLKYLGRKAIGRLGCYACHDIPGFDRAKPIGVGLNDWGKKNPERLAFEDIANFVSSHFNVVPSLTNKEGKPIGPVVDSKGVTKLPYEKYFADLLDHHAPQREGYLNQKILDPRSYDYNRVRTWDDRSRMPQFRFARSRKLANETNEEFEARTWRDEAEAREAVMTFILGLVADPVPQNSINQPKGDRLAEIKGRQVLDKFNCGGCHQIQPGLFEFKPGPKTVAMLDRINNGVDYNFHYHYDWAGKNPPAPDRVVGSGVRMKLVENEDAEGDDDKTFFNLRLSHALRYPSEKDKGLRDIYSAKDIRILPKDVIYPPPAALKSEETLKAFLRDQGPYGGAFADLLVNYLIDKNSKSSDTVIRDIFKRELDGDNSNARIAAPPLLVGQGERTQSEWLYTFLLDPFPVRKMSVLRMPKFNMSPDDAKALVDYFAASERIQNPNTPLTHPQEIIPQAQGVGSDYWNAKTKEYVARLKQTKTPSGKTVYDQRVEELKPLFNQILKDYESSLDIARKRVEQAKAQLEESTKIEQAAKKALDGEKDEAAKKKLDVKFKEAEDVRKADENIKAVWESEVASLTANIKSSSLANQQKKWDEEQAYLNDAYKLVANRQLCQQCHQIGNLQAGQQLTQGPPLDKVHNRLRPGWTERWIASPQRFLTYKSVMPNNFPADAKDVSTQYFAGTIFDQLIAARDLIMAHPQASALPVNQFWAMPLPGEKK